MLVFAFDSFKGSLSSLQAGEAAAKAAKEVMPESINKIVPVADGGEGTVEAIVSALNGDIITARATAPLGNKIEASYGVCGDTAVIEMAAASGLTLVAEENRNPWLTTSFGTGELIHDAIKRGCRKFLIGIGGSATNDGGTGMLRALGYRFLDKEGNEISGTGGETGKIAETDFTGILPELKDCSFTVACDVSNPLTGKNGASHVFAPQKGATPEMVEKLDAGLSSFARIIAGTTGKDLSAYPGAGAAGGLGFAFISFLNARLAPGIEMVLDAVKFDSILEKASKEKSVVFTGEGRLDRQTCMGKAPYGILKRALKYGIPVIALGGSIEPGAEASLLNAGFTKVRSITPEGMPLSEAMKPEIAAKNIKTMIRQLLTNSN